MYVLYCYTYNYIVMILLVHFVQGYLTRNIVYKNTSVNAPVNGRDRARASNTQ